MPYKDPEARRAAHRKSDRKARLRRLKDALRQGRYNWSDKGKAARARYNRSPKGKAALAAAKARYRAKVRAAREDRATELARLIAEQARDAATYKIKTGPEFWDAYEVVDGREVHRVRRTDERRFDERRFAA